MKEKKSISMDINKKELLKMLSAYYSEKLGKEVDVQVDATKITSGYGPGEYEECNLEFYFTQEVNIGQTKVKVISTLGEEDMQEALNEIVGKLNYSIESITYDSGIRYDDDDYCRDIVKEAYFNGVKLELKEKGIKKVLEER